MNLISNMNELKYIINIIGFAMMICTIVIFISLLANSENYTDRDYYTTAMAGFFTATISYISIVITIYCEHNK